MTPAQTICVATLVGVVAVIAVVDLWLWRRYTVDGTISRTLKAWNKIHPWLSALTAFLMGCLFGHLYL